jgi:hypothetical protein
MEFGSGAALVLAGAAIVVPAGVLLFLGPAVERRAYLAVVLACVLAAVPWGSPWIRSPTRPATMAT